MYAAQLFCCQVGVHLQSMGTNYRQYMIISMQEKAWYAHAVQLQGSLSSQLLQQHNPQHLVHAHICMSTCTHKLAAAS
jgi:hypothetical protein